MIKTLCQALTTHTLKVIVKRGKAQYLKLFIVTFGIKNKPTPIKLLIGTAKPCYTPPPL